ncbi:MAG: hypothetical protein CL834_01545 [Crocinitomicaceae bacterium]|nr:hypothetical protein [Crocinitomicaceae bacterium]
MIIGFQHLHSITSWVVLAFVSVHILKAWSTKRNGSNFSEKTWSLPLSFRSLMIIRVSIAWPIRPGFGVHSCLSIG